MGCSSEKVAPADQATALTVDDHGEDAHRTAECPEEPGDAPIAAATCKPMMSLDESTVAGQRVCGGQPGCGGGGGSRRWTTGCVRGTGLHGGLWSRSGGSSKALRAPRGRRGAPRDDLGAAKRNDKTGGGKKWVAKAVCASSSCADPLIPASSVSGASPGDRAGASPSSADPWWERDPWSAPVAQKAASTVKLTAPSVAPTETDQHVRGGWVGGRDGGSRRGLGGCGRGLGLDSHRSHRDGGSMTSWAHRSWGDVPWNNQDGTQWNDQTDEGTKWDNKVACASCSVSAGPRVQVSPSTVASPSGSRRTHRRGLLRQRRVHFLSSKIGGEKTGRDVLRNELLQVLDAFTEDLKGLSAKHQGRLHALKQTHAGHKQNLEALAAHLEEVAHLAHTNKAQLEAQDTAQRAQVEDLKKTIRDDIRRSLKCEIGSAYAALNREVFEWHKAQTTHRWHQQTVLESLDAALRRELARSE